MRWLDRHGTPLPLDDVFAAYLMTVKQRAGGAASQSVQRRKKHHAVDEADVLIVRDYAGSHVLKGAVCDPSPWRWS